MNLFLSHAQLRRYGLSSADLRRGVPPGALEWPLRGEVRARLAPVLSEAGFPARSAITVRESRKPAGFELADARRLVSTGQVSRGRD
jgi:hypothetical protein